MGTPIPQPPSYPFFGNVREIDPVNTVESFVRLSEIYGPVFRLQFPNGSRVILGSQEIFDEVCDEKRFIKRPLGNLIELRNGTADSLFTAFTEEENWGIAHRILMPLFGPLAMKKMFDELHLIASELVSYWAKLGPSHRINVTQDFTKLTLDSIALCTMDTRFNSFYRTELHPFVASMNFFLRESGIRAARPQFVSDYVYRASTREYWESINSMKRLAKSVIEERRARPLDKKDLVNSMLYSEDPKTGKKMTEENIINNMITFLIAGHETTSGLLSFLFMSFLLNPRVFKKAQQEVDEVLGKGKIEYHHLDKLKYLVQCVRETLRLYPTAPAFALTPISQDERDFPMFIGKERYEIRKGEALVSVLPLIHKDPAVWGEDANEFKPERMTEENFKKLPSHSWAPFGQGSRACIGRNFAITETYIAAALLLQNFDFRLEDPSYRVHISQTLTIKPADLFMYATLRQGLDPVALEQRLWSGGEEHKPGSRDKVLEAVALQTDPEKKAKPMTILYGSNTGTCEALAQSLANSALSHGLKAEVKPMDSASGKIPKDQPVVIATASYEGEPADNACHFIEWLRGLKGNELEGVNYAVLGSGHHDWASTFHKIPILVDELFKEHGAKEIVKRGLIDAANNDIFNDFDRWADDSFWPALTKDSAGSNGVVSSGLDLDLNASPRGSDLRQDVSEAIVRSEKVLTAPGEPEKRHIEIELPSSMNYSAGDYLAVLPMNHVSAVHAVLSRFGIAWDTKVTIRKGQNTFLPMDRELDLRDLLSSYVELGQPATHKNIRALLNFVGDDEHGKKTRQALEELLAGDEVARKRIPVFDIVEKYPDIAISFSDFLGMLPPMRVRQYSISSSPLANEKPGDAAVHVGGNIVTLTFAVLNQEAGIGSGKRYLGTASNYLSTLRAGDRVHVAVKSSPHAFHPPLDVANVPMIMVCAGSGLAPFRGFVQERAAQIAAGNHRSLAPALLFVGCRHPDRDLLYKAEFEEWTKMGAVDVRYAFSKAQDRSGECKYVQDILWKDREDVTALWKKGAKLFVCGNSQVGEAVKQNMLRAYAESRSAATKEDAEKWFEKIKNERYASDVFA